MAEKWRLVKVTHVAEWTWTCDVCGERAAAVTYGQWARCGLHVPDDYRAAGRCSQCLRTEADVARLRAALTAIATMPTITETWDADLDRMVAGYDAMCGPDDIAKAALEGRPWEGIGTAEEARHG